MDEKSPPWKKSAKALLDTFRSGAPRRAFDEADFMRSAIVFADTGSLRTLAMQVSGIPIPDGPIDDRRWQVEADRQTAQRFAAEREQFRADLALVIAKTIDADFRKRVTEGARVIKVPQVQGGNHYVVLELSAALYHALELLLNRELPYGKDLHRCQLETCQRPFLTSVAQGKKKHSTGLPRTKYCSDKCMLEQRALNRRLPKKGK